MNTEKFSKAFNIMENKKNNIKSNSSLKSSNSIKSSKFLQVTEESDYQIYEENTLKSFNIKNSEFTNFLNRHQISDYKEKVSNLFDNLVQLNNENKAILLSVDLKDIKPDIYKKTKEIMLKFISEDDFLKFEDMFLKYNILDKLKMSTPYRIFLYKDFNKNKYIIFLIDPHHLVITDKKTRKNKVYKNNINNDICISKFQKTP
ncbi:MULTISPECIES: hypothetical protein [unclassified Gemella]|uniref:hypothetical protein n=1 Tax=unclassified Gemella TaxID=2624949 RepID=UPI001C04D4A9|nr:MULTISPECIES: hypothetical protein [unclassified Gemella]MBU0279296.1 hypothetical protein [Gemella sp. zg-1178]QWQ39141.1 hypothetical protein KMP11_02060 [Gemella sp. zg-570]